MKNKRGEETVEAAIVLPLLILTILTMILVIVFYFSCLTDQTDLHREIETASQESKRTFDRIEKKAETSSKAEGIISGMFRKKISGRGYVLNQADILRAGELIGID